MCDLAYLLQVRQLREEALAQMQLAPYVKEAGSLPTPDSAETDFGVWLNGRPGVLDEGVDPADVDLRELLMGGGRAR